MSRGASVSRRRSVGLSGRAVEEGRWFVTSEEGWTGVAVEAVILFRRPFFFRRSFCPCDCEASASELLVAPWWSGGTGRRGGGACVESGVVAILEVSSSPHAVPHCATSRYGFLDTTPPCFASFLGMAHRLQTERVRLREVENALEVAVRGRVGRGLSGIEPQLGAQAPHFLLVDAEPQRGAQAPHFL